MKRYIIYWALVIFTLTAFKNKSQNLTTGNMQMTNGYAEVNGLKMYYEIYGHGKPIVLIHGGGSTIQTSFEKLIPLLTKNRKVLAVELQAHGRTNDRSADLTFEQDADDVVALLQKLNIDKADFLGFSNGGTTSLQIAIRHPKIVDKMILCSALAKRNGVPDWFWGFMSQAKLENMPNQLKEAYRKVAANADDLQVMHDKDVKRMVNFKDIPDEQIKAIKSPNLIIIGDKDVITPEHATELHKLLANSELAIIPGGHGEYIGEITTLKANFKEGNLALPLIEKFLNKTVGEKSTNINNMKKLQFIISINAPVYKVYDSMLGLKSKSTYEQWTSLFNPTSTYEGSWDKGNKILFIGVDEKGEKGGMVSRIAENIPNKFVSVQHYGLFKAGNEITEGPEVEKWANGFENYTFEEKNGITTVTVELDTNEDFLDYMKNTYPKALNKLKELCEQ